jgi:uncharacterized protein (TIGR00369 family)
MHEKTHFHLVEQARVAEKELARQIKQTNVGHFFGFELEAAEAGRAVVRLRVRPHHRQIHGVVHGGVIGALADTAGGLATYMAVPRGTRVATVEMKINFLEAVEKGTVTAEARVLRRGRNFAVVDCDVRDAAGQLVAKALMTFSYGPSPDEASSPLARPEGSRRNKSRQEPRRRKGL